LIKYFWRKFTSELNLLKNFIVSLVEKYLILFFINFIIHLSSNFIRIISSLSSEFWPEPTLKTVFIFVFYQYMGVKKEKVLKRQTYNLNITRFAFFFLRRNFAYIFIDCAIIIKLFLMSWKSCYGFAETDVA